MSVVATMAVWALRLEIIMVVVWVLVELVVRVSRLRLKALVGAIGTMDVFIVGVIAGWVADKASMELGVLIVGLEIAGEGLTRWS